MKTFYEVIAGKSNKLALYVLKNFAKGDNYKGNLVYLYGKSGTGKTHLLKALRYEEIKNYPQRNVLYKTGLEIVDEILNEIRNKNRYNLKEKYRLTDILLVDDIDLLKGKPATQIEFVKIIIYFFLNKKGLIITSNNNLKQFIEINDRLDSIINSCKIVEIKEPENKMKKNFLIKELKSNGVVLKQKELKYLVKKMSGNIFTLKSAIIRIKCFPSLK